MSAPHTGIWPEPVVTALAWILANRLPGASLSDLDVIRLRLDLDDGSKAEFSDHGGRGEVRVHRLRDDLEVWQTGPAPGKRHSGRFAVAQPCEPGAAFLATYEVRDHRVDEEAVMAWLPVWRAVTYAAPDRTELEMVIFGFDARDWPMDVILCEGDVWFDLCAVCRALHIRDVDAEADTLASADVIRTYRSREDGGVDRVIRCNWRGLQSVMDNTDTVPSMQFQLWVYLHVIPCIELARQQIAEDAQSSQPRSSKGLMLF